MAGEDFKGGRSMSDLIQKLVAECHRIEEDAEHSSKGHYNASSRWGHYHLLLGLPAAIIAAIAGAVAFNDWPELAGGLALLSTALTTVLTFLKPSERAEMHKSVGGQYHALRNQARIFREIELTDGIDTKTAKERLLVLARLRDELNASSPGISRCDYEKAKEDIDAGRARYRIDGGES
jgi:hypothetical protein